MRKIIIISILILIIIISWYAISVNKNKPQTIRYKLEGKEYNLLTAKNSQEWEKGLMFVRSRQGYDGMIFLFPDKEYRTFWNKNTYLDLDIYWINGDKVVGKDKLLSIDKSKEVVTVSSIVKVDKVIEIIKNK